jgi:hypothetical protein
MQAQDPKLESRIEKQVEKVIMYPRNQKHLDKLAYYYSEANSMDKSRIMELRASGRPEIWYEVYLRSKRLDERQKMVMSVPKSSLEKIGFREFDYSTDIEQAKNKAAAFFYAHASALLDSGGQKEARLAYDELYLLAGIYPKYRDLDKMIRRAVPEAAESLNFELHNKTGQELNSSIVSGVSRSFKVINDKKKSYQGKGKARYDFTIRINLDEIKITPEQVKTRAYREERDIFDENNQVVDTISCDVTEHFQRKAALLKGNIQYVDNSKDLVINTVPVTVESIFLHKYGSVQGDIEAMSEETKSLVGRSEAVYPSNEALILDAVGKFRSKAEMILKPYGEKPSE